MAKYPLALLPVVTITGGTARLIGDALYDGAFTFSEAMAAGADRFDMFYWGPPQ